MNELKIFDNEEFGEIRTININGEPWFVGRDVANALGYKKPENAIASNVDSEDTLKQGILTAGGKQQMTIINESGLYSLIFSSKLESAKRFKHWVTSEVLPSIRKTGGYANEQLILLHPSIASGVADLGRVTERIMKNQGSAPYKIAETFKCECEQFGIKLPEDFVKISEYEQLKLVLAE